MVEITGRTMQGRFLFVPSDTFNDIALGVLGRAQRVDDARLGSILVPLVDASSGFSPIWVEPF